MQISGTKKRRHSHSEDEAVVAKKDADSHDSGVEVESTESSKLQRPKKLKKLKPRDREPRRHEQGTLFPLDRPCAKKITTSDFRDLAIYLLLSGKVPQWLTVHQKDFIRKVVIVMVPGLTRSLFKISESRAPSDDRVAYALSDIGTPAELVHLTRNFRYLWPTGCPGDSYRVYSPVNAMLQVPLKSKDRKVAHKEVVKGAQMLQYLTKLDQMIDQSYPIHPSFGNAQPLHPGYVATQSHSTLDESALARKKVIAVDCEMVKTENGSELARVTLIGASMELILDELVRPRTAIIDYVTQWSGITPEMLENVTTSLEDIQHRLSTIISDETILLGHSIESDLHALKMAHPHLIDTSLIYDHPRGPPYKASLRWLSEKWAKKVIQQNRAGHDSAEDARACMALLLLKLRNGPEFGRYKVDVESIFHTLMRNASLPKTSAVVDYGNPRQWHGANATDTISCNSDDEIIDNIIKVAPLHDFVWARLKDLERLNGWASDIDRLNIVGGDPDEGDVSQYLTLLDARLQKLYTSLPSCTALLLYSGTGDPREMSRLQNRRKAHREEFKTRKWHQLSITWTGIRLQL